ncbi:MAG: chorismate mutase, partial [Spirosomataceae bacterium]
MKLKQIREKIDAIDDELLVLLNKRMELVREVGLLKQAERSVIYRPEREKEILERLISNNKGLLTPPAIEAIFL